MKKLIFTEADFDPEEEFPFLVDSKEAAEIAQKKFDEWFQEFMKEEAKLINHSQLDLFDWD
jgi:hypothetical protein